MRKQLLNTIRNLQILYQRHSDARNRLLINFLNVKVSKSLFDASVNDNYANQIKYLAYMESRIGGLLKKGETLKALYILIKLYKRSKSLALSPWLFNRITQRTINRIKIEELLRLTIWKELLDKALGIFEFTVMLLIMLLIFGTRPEVGEFVLSDKIEVPEQGIIPMFITICIGIVMVLLLLREEEIPEIPVSGPMTEMEYAWLQDTLSYQAWLENLSISPIGQLWTPPF